MSSPPAPPGWEYFLCFEDNRDIGYPLFTGAGYADSAGMTVEHCAAFCDSQSVSYRFMGITDGFQCSCDNYFEYIFESEPDDVCETPCPGNPSEAGFCGGMDGYTPTASTYQKINSTFVTPALVSSVGSWNGLGCYNDSISARALQVTVNAGSTTVESCVAACQAQEFTLAGVEYGRECWCGSQLQHGSTFYGNANGIDTTAPFHRYDPNGVYCDMGCEGNPAETCGGPALLDLYKFTGTYPIGASVVPASGEWSSIGCYSDTVSSRTLERSVNAGSVTVESCVSACQSQMFTIAGLEYAQECWCGNEINSPGAPISQSSCNQACTGNSTEVCGGPDALQLYKFTATYPLGASVVPAAGGWTSRGCYSDSVSSRTLERSVNAGNVTVESCVSACQSQSFTMAGLEYAHECWCGNAINSPGAPIAQSACDQTCVGNDMEVCGGPDALQMYY
ncbi:WSC domain-containing protein [Lactarius quietus]|nr:WSC domain-containing protein [Lactarius quietus]